MDVKFNLKLFVLVGVLAGFRDVCGMEAAGADDDFYVNGLVKGNKDFIDAVKGNRVIKAVYKTEEGGDVDLIDSDFQNQLSSIFVWDGKEVKKVEAKYLVNDFFRIVYNMSEKVDHTVYFIFKDDSVVESTKSMFYGCLYLISADFRCFNTENVTDMSYMFSGCSSLKELNLSNLVTSNVKDMSHMFYNCSSLKELDISNFDTKNVTNMSNMFYGCTSLKELYLVDFDFSNVGNMENMFLGCNFDKLFLHKKYKDIRNRYCCCGDEYVYINAKKVVEFNPHKVVFCEYDDLVTKEAAKLV